MKALKEDELREYCRCCSCQKLIGECPLPVFWIVNAERHGLKLEPVSRQTGLAMVLGGSAQLAGIMGPDEDMTEPLSETKKMICDTCMVEKLPEFFEEDD